jgi:hypothetical protein
MTARRMGNSDESWRTQNGGKFTNFGEIKNFDAFYYSTKYNYVNPNINATSHALVKLARHSTIHEHNFDGLISH